ncbi:MAG: hypothetical protein QOJ07_2589 [Thermoleophilaceae bacterium]|jgi:hypothetical protein|nr:hypothetical protein [Thermoleophilaceae bacterium]
MLAHLLAQLPLPDDVKFDPSPKAYIGLFAAGFAVAVLGHIFKSKTLVAGGILMVFLATILLPLIAHLSNG